MRSTKYTREVLEPVVKSSRSLAEVMRKLGLRTTGGNYRHISLRIRRREIGLLELGWSYECAWCGISEWRGRKLVLHLDHANGIHNDNRFENIRLLCPNCHSQTATYSNRRRE